MADHPVKVPAELVKEWINDGPPLDQPKHVARFIADRAAQWGADQELEACCEYLQSEIGPLEAAHFRAARRPKPPTLAEQGLMALGSPVGPNHVLFLTAANQDDIRAALNRLAELEAQQ